MIRLTIILACVVIYLAGVAISIRRDIRMDDRHPWR